VVQLVGEIGRFWCKIPRVHSLFRWHLYRTGLSPSCCTCTSSQGHAPLCGTVKFERFFWPGGFFCFFLSSSPPPRNSNSIPPSPFLIPLPSSSRNTAAAKLLLVPTKVIAYIKRSCPSFFLSLSRFRLLFPSFPSFLFSRGTQNLGL